MVNDNTIIQRDLQHVWHPCSQMKDFEQSPPLVVTAAKGSYLYTDQGPIIDAISSWWCKSLGHGSPTVIAAIVQQLTHFEHVIGAHTTYPQMVELAEELAAISGRQHIFFASDGSCAVEIALKLALHANQIKGHATRTKFIALKNAYHGETLGTLSVSDLKMYKAPYDHFGLRCHFLQSIPYVSGKDDPLWHNCDSQWPLILQELEAAKADVCAIIIEPIVQGAGGMHAYSADFLKKLTAWAKCNDIYLIADEIMTGMGRTGKWLACDHAEVKADMICLSKGLTSGSLPLSCVLIDSEIYNLFYGDYDQGNSFLHSHTYSGNPLAISAALATIKTMRAENINQQAEQLGESMLHYFSEIAALTGKLSNVRSVGAWVAGDLESIDNQRTGFQLYQHALRQGALLRPIGNTLYWLPPLNTDHETIVKLADITLNSINTLYS